MRRGFFCARERALPLTRPSSQPALCEGGDRAERRGRRGGKRQEKPLPRKVPLTPAEPARLGQAPPLGTCLAGVISAAWVQARGCKGRSPLHKNNLKSPPSPEGKGGGGIGGRNQSERQGRQAAKKARPPQVHLLYGRDNQCRKRSNAGVPGAKPLAKLTYSLPLPRRGRGAGDGGRIKAKGRVSRRHRRQARTGA